MSMVRKLAVRTANALPRAWKRHLKWSLTIPDMGASIENMKRAGFSPQTALDIGAYVGDWTRMAKEIFPACQVCMFEPQQDKEPGLRRLMQELPEVTLKRTLLGDVPDTSVSFYPLESGSSTSPSRNMPSDLKPIVLPSTTLETAVAGTPFARPDLIKIDVQGAELKVLRGGLSVLSAAQVVILEVSLVEEYKGSPLFVDVISFMAQQGFRVYDVCTIWRNNRTMSMNEADVIFVRHGSSLLNPANYTRDPAPT